MIFIPQGNPIIGGAQATAVYASSNSNNSSPINTITRNSQALGTETPKRRTCVVLYSTNANLVVDNGSPLSVTVGGVGLTKVFQDPASSTVFNTVWFSDTVANGGPTGSTATISVTRSSGNGFTSLTGWSIYAVYNLRSTTVFDFIPRTVANPTPSGNIDLKSGGIVLGMAGIAGTSHIWTGLLEDVDTTGGVGGASNYTNASLSETPAATNFAISVNGGAATTFFAASFR